MMYIEELNGVENAIIELIRAFKFLRQEGYYEQEILIREWSKPSIIYHNSKANRIVKILGSESQSWAVVIQRRKLINFKKDDSFFEISDYYKSFGGSMMKGKNYTLKAQVDFIQQHLMPVIKGEVWIDDLLKQKNK